MRKRIAALGCALGCILGIAPLLPLPARADSPITIYRDHFGVPHVEARTLQGAAYGMGYVEASDRLFEMEIFRLYAQGRLSEFVGPSMLPVDEYTRREFLVPGQVDAQYAALDSVVSSMLRAFTKGINDAAVRTWADPQTHPALYDILGVPSPALNPWTPQQCLEMLMLFSTDLFGGDGGAGQLEKADLLAHLRAKYGAASGLRIFNDVYPPIFTDAPSIIPAGQGTPPPPVGYDVTGPAASQEPLIGLPGLSRTARAYSAAMATVHSLILHSGLPLPHFGSFGAAVAGSHTQSHGGLLLGSPQAGLESPPIFYEVGIHIPGVTDCEGTTVPGFGPALAIGWCNQHAWTLIAANVGAQADLYAEKLNPGNPHQYWFNGAWKDTVQDTETYIVKGITCSPALPLPPVPLPVAVTPGGLPLGPCTPQVIQQTYDYTVHGAISTVDDADHVGFAYRRAQQTNFAANLYGALAENFSHSFTEFRDGGDASNTTLHQLYADSAGNISYRLTGLQPIRPGLDRRFPMSGTGNDEWQGFLTNCQMPYNVNPPEGYIAVNQGTESKPASWWPNSSQTAIGIVARPRHDRELLAALPPAATMETLRQLEVRYLQQDDPEASLFYPLFAHALAGTTDPQLQQASTLLEQWRADRWQRTNRQSAAVEDHPGLALFEMDDYDEYGTGGAFATPIGDLLIKAVVGGITDGRLPGNTYMGRMSVVYDALTHRLSQDWVPDPDALLRSTIKQVIATLSDGKHYGTPDMTRWHARWPSVAFTVIGINSAPAPIQGFDHGSYSQIVDLGLLSGESIEPPGDVASDSYPQEFQPNPHGYDQRDLYQAFAYKPMRLAPAVYRSDTESVTALSDGGGFGADTQLDFQRFRDPCRNAVAPQAVAPATGSTAALPNTAAGPAWPVIPVLVAGLAAVRVRRRRGRAGGDPRR